MSATTITTFPPRGFGKYLRELQAKEKKFFSLQYSSHRDYRLVNVSDIDSAICQIKDILNRGHKAGYLLHGDPNTWSSIVQELRLAIPEADISASLPTLLFVKKN